MRLKPIKKPRSKNCVQVAKNCRLLILSGVLTHIDPQEQTFLLIWAFDKSLEKNRG